ncbi:hypothetical protein [Mesorhizobium sp. B2-6-7]|uniref:hypothetical protein n=1 Tax=Mesorhizobium sp. B2-6-7 TaxID=2589910 RepID=UPI00112BA848|nr:hypothetical protein [Mesorhizobium sp. B2-6-7]TPJ70452.1 hypothetical protein FJ462_07080 [Mesorhizobium sp. B2-6-7]
MWTKIKSWFKDSETIFVARLQVLIGIVLTALAAIDPATITPYIDPKYVPLVLVGLGIVTEWARRRRAKDM